MKHLPLLAFIFLNMLTASLHAENPYRIQICQYQFTTAKDTAPPLADERLLHVLMKEKNSAGFVFGIDQTFADNQEITRREGDEIQIPVAYDNTGKPTQTEPRFVGLNIRLKVSVTTDKKRIFLTGNIDRIRQEPSMLGTATNGNQILLPILASESMDNLQWEIALGQSIFLLGPAMPKDGHTQYTLTAIAVSSTKSKVPLPVSKP
jgi:hypothetical protein